MGWAAPQSQDSVSIVIGVARTIEGSGEDRGMSEGMSRVVMCFVEASAAVGKHHQSYGVSGNGRARRDGMIEEPYVTFPKPFLY